MNNDFERIIKEAEFQVAEGETTWKDLFIKVIKVIEEEDEERKEALSSVESSLK